VATVRPCQTPGEEKDPLLARLDSGRLCFEAFVQAYDDCQRQTLAYRGFDFRPL